MPAPIAKRFVRLVDRAIDRVRELPDARAGEVADMLTAYAAAWNAEPHVGDDY